MDTRRLRNGIQVGFAVLVLYIGWQFARFAGQFPLAQGEPVVARPPGVEGFLPISALMALKRWVVAGQFDAIHPAGLVLFVTIIGLAFLLRKGFCGWLCPIGTLAEALGRAGERLLGARLDLPKFIDIPLRAVKFLVLGFFVKIIVIDLPIPAIAGFLDAPYNKIADVKMLRFFLAPSTTTITALLILTVLSVVIRNFWCRYLCPYGALLGIVAAASPAAVTRDPELCTRCARCTQACPNRIVVEKAERVVSPECTGCCDCVAACPQKGALSLRFAGVWAVTPAVYAVALVGLFMIVTFAARLTGYWESTLTLADYERLIPFAEFFGH